MKYRAVKGSRLTDDQAQAYGERLAMLNEELEGELTPEAVLNDAADKASPMHKFFTWDDAEAANKYREMQAYYLLRSINVVVEREDGTEIETRAFVHVHVLADDPDDGIEVHGVYVTVQRAMTEEELRQQVIEEALRQVREWRTRYAQYQELEEIFKAVDVITAKVALVEID